MLHRSVKRGNRKELGLTSAGDPSVEEVIYLGATCFMALALSALLQ